MPAMSSARVAVTAPSVSRTLRYARPDRLRNQAVENAITGMMIRAASASRQLRKNSTTAVPTSSNVF